MPIDPRLLGGEFATEADFVNKPGGTEALLARQAGLNQGFTGKWGEGRFNEFQQGVNSVPAPVTPAPVTAAPQSVFQQPTIDYNLLASQIPQVDYNKIGGLMAPLTTGQVGLTQGQADLTQGQAGLTQGQAGLAGGQAGMMAGQQILGEGQQTIGQGVGMGLDLMGQPTQQQPQTLFAGQEGLMQGQQQIGGGVQNVGRDIGSLSGDLSVFQRAVQAYQQKAMGDRQEALKAGISGRTDLGQQVGDVGESLTGQVRDVGLQANQVAERQANMTNQGSLQQQSDQAGQVANTMGRNFNNVAPQQQSLMGPTGPVAIDPRDMVRFGPTGSPV
jgi:hypothetical protein